MVLNLRNYSQRSYFCLPTLRHSPHVQHFLAAIHKKNTRKKRERERYHQKQPTLKLSHCFFMLNVFPSSSIIYIHKKTNLKLMVMHAAYYKINTYSYAYRKKNEHRYSIAITSCINTHKNMLLIPNKNLSIVLK